MKLLSEHQEEEITCFVVGSRLKPYSDSKANGLYIGSHGNQQVHDKCSQAQKKIT